MRSILRHRDRGGTAHRRTGNRGLDTTDTRAIDLRFADPANAVCIGKPRGAGPDRDSEGNDAR